MNEHEMIQQLAKKHFGIVVQDHQVAYVNKTINGFLVELGYRSTKDYMQALTQDLSVSSPEMKAFSRAVTVNESYFFRVKPQIMYLKEQLLPKIIAARRLQGDLRINIWSAGCAAGQEIYTVAILLSELLTDFDSWQLNLMGTDINEASLLQAKKGVYSRFSLRATTPEDQVRYFTKHDDQFELKKCIRDKVTFSHLNFRETTYPDAEKGLLDLDLLLCRNVFIYFSSDDCKTIFSRFMRCLSPEGVIMLGPSDYLDTAGLNIQFSLSHGVATYRLIPKKTDQVKAIIKPPEPVEKTKPSKRVQKRSLSTIVTGSQRKQSKHTEKQKEAPLPPRYWDKAMVLANAGQTDAALKLCQHWLAIDDSRVEVYLLMGVIYQSLNQVEKAFECFDRALYLDLACVEALYHWSVLAIRDNNPKALSRMARAVELAKKTPGEALLILEKNMTFQRFAPILELELQHMTLK
jgi:chemotaxis protein methyltransferase CheR